MSCESNAFGAERTQHFVLKINARVSLQMLCAFKCMQEVKYEDAAVNVPLVKRCEFI